jgi:DNA-binding MarR family transcriptional regulator
MPNTPEAPPTASLIDELGHCSLQLMWTLRQDAARAFDPLGFRTVRALLLEFVGRGHTQPKALAAMLGTVPPAVSTIIAELEERGLLLRRSDPHDGRRVHLSLTEAGEAARLELRHAWNQAGLKRLSGFSDEELEVFLRLCRKLLRTDPPD